MLEVVEGDAGGQRISVATELLIGRSAEGDGNLAGDPELSRRHAVVRRADDGGLTIEDLGSLNGTYVNGAAVAEPAGLAPGDRIELGRTVIEVGADTPPDERQPPAAPASQGRASAALVHAGRRYPLSGKGLVIGRGEDCDLRIDSRLASRRHARIVEGDGFCLVVDLDSVNGTILNGRPLHGESRPIGDGDTLTIAGETLRFVAGRPASCPERGDE